MICSPSFLTSDFKNLESEILTISKAEWIHFDVMDGKFVPNYTYDHHILQRIKKISNQFFDCHLMIVEPEKYVKDYIEAGADLITFHLEASRDPKSLIHTIKSAGVKAGISIKPNTDICDLNPYLEYVDNVLVMSVEPGKGGQKFRLDSLEKIKYLNHKRKEMNYDYLIEVDGGINLETAKLVKEAGNDVIVVGSFIFNSLDRNSLIEALENV